MRTRTPKNKRLVNHQSFIQRNLVDPKATVACHNWAKTIIKFHLEFFRIPLISPKLELHRVLSARDILISVKSLLTEMGYCFQLKRQMALALELPNFSCHEILVSNHFVKL
jgi:hypothetical protein